MAELQEGWEEPDCPCGSSAVAGWMSAPDRLFGAPGEFHVATCAGCGLRRTSPRPDATHVMAFYPEEYGPHHHPDGRPAVRRGTGRARGWLRRRLGTGATGLPPLSASWRAVELGCGGGSFLAELADAGLEVSGVEPSAAAAARARVRSGVPVAQQSIAEVDFDPASLDLVVAWMVLEHLHNPVETIERIHGWLRPGGVLALSVPDSASYPARTFKSFWYGLQVPTHLFHYSRASLSGLLAGGGFEITRLADQRTVDDWRTSLALVLASKRGWRSRAAPLLEHRLVRLAFRAAGPLGGLHGVSGRLTVWARKPAERT
jgi:SAM-dependent methyltransferase